MDLNPEVCRNIAVQYGLPLQFVIKEFHVFEVLGRITAATACDSFENRGLAATENFVFKGGTALNKVYFEKTQRFSEDLDFDLGVGNIEDAKKWCRRLSEKISGYTVEEFRRVKDTVQFYCAFETPWGSKDHIRVDVAVKKILHEKPLEMKPAVSEYAKLFVSGFKVYSIEDLTARKIHALGTRTEGKDLFDVYRALPLCGGMAGAMKKMLESEQFRGSAEEFVERTIDAVKKADAKKLQKLTNPFIPYPERPKDWRELKNDVALKLEALEKKVAA